MRWRIAWLAETLMVPVWLAGEWLEETLSRWYKAAQEAKRYLVLSVPGDWEV